MEVICAFISTNYEGCGEPVYVGDSLKDACKSLFGDDGAVWGDYWVIQLWEYGRLKNRASISTWEWQNRKKPPHLRVVWHEFVEALAINIKESPRSA